MSFNQSVQKSLELLQDEICLGLENLDGRSKFREDKWVREGGGGGRTRIIENGDLIEKGGVNFSAVHGKLPDVVKNSLGATENEFFACGVSIVLHPNSPYVPIIHMNVRYFELGDGTYWFGGGIDLTPHFVDRSLATKFHKRLKHTCDQFQSDFYPKFKVWADDYFSTSTGWKPGVLEVFFTISWMKKNLIYPRTNCWTLHSLLDRLLFRPTQSKPKIGLIRS